MKRATALSLLVLLFGTGLLAGILGTHVFYAYRVARPGGLAELGFGLVGQRLRMGLDLTPQQAQELDVILEDARRETLSLRSEVVESIVEIRSQSLDRLQTILSPEQQKRLEELRVAGDEGIDWFAGEG